MKYSIRSRPTMVPYSTNNLVGQALTVVGYYYDSTGTLTEGPVAVSNIVVNATPEPTALPLILVIAVIIALAVIMLAKTGRWKFSIMLNYFILFSNILKVAS